MAAQLEREKESINIVLFLIGFCERIQMDVQITMVGNDQIGASSLIYNLNTASSECIVVLDALNEYLV